MDKNGVMTLKNISGKWAIIIKLPVTIIFLSHVFLEWLFLNTKTGHFALIHLASSFVLSISVSLEDHQRPSS